jgi:vancomycin permeability regulator SanA
VAQSSLARELTFRQVFTHMLDKLIQFISRLFWVVLLIFAMTVGVMVYEGLQDSPGHADLAIVPGHTEMDSGDAWEIVQARLDKAITLYQDNKISMILVSGSEKTSDYYEAGSMVQYLEAKGVPSKAIMGDEGSGDTPEMVGRWLVKIKEGKFTSVMLVTHYYQISRLKVAFWKQAGVPVGQTHVGNLQAADTYDIVRENIEFYRYLVQAYLGPTWRHAGSELKKWNLPWTNGSVRR